MILEQLIPGGLITGVMTPGIFIPGAWNPRSIYILPGMNGLRIKAPMGQCPVNPMLCGFMKVNMLFLEIRTGLQKSG